MNNFKKLLENELNELFGFGKKKKQTEWYLGGQADEYAFSPDDDFYFGYVQLSWENENPKQGESFRDYAQKFLWVADWGGQYGGNFGQNTYFKTFNSLATWAKKKFNLDLPTTWNAKFEKESGAHQFGSGHTTKKEAMAVYKKAK